MPQAVSPTLAGSLRTPAFFRLGVGTYQRLLGSSPQSVGTLTCQGGAWPVSMMCLSHRPLPGFPGLPAHSVLFRRCSALIGINTDRTHQQLLTSAPRGSARETFGAQLREYEKGARPSVHSWP